MLQTASRKSLSCQFVRLLLPGTIQTSRCAKFSDIAAQSAASSEATSISSAAEPAGEVRDVQQIEQPSTSQRHTNRHRQHRHRDDPGNIFRPAHEKRFPVRLTNLTQSVTRSDVARFFTNFNVTENDVRPEFDPHTLETRAWWILFHRDEDRRDAAVLQRRFLGTHRAFIRPIENIGYMIDHLRCPLAMHSRGRTVLVDNIEISTSLSGILRHFEGYELQGNAATIINAGSRMKDDEYHKQTQYEKFKASSPLQHNALATEAPEHQQKKDALARNTLRAVVRFATTEEAHRAVRNRNHTYLGNRRVSLRVLP
ncbi:g7586 [Coccomyxa elongata]